MSAAGQISWDDQPQVKWDDESAGKPTPITDDTSVSAAPSGLGRVTAVTDAVGRAGLTSNFPYVHPLDAIAAGTQAVENQIPNKGVAGSAKELAFGGQAVGKPMGTSSGLLNNPVTAAMGGADDAANLGSAITRRGSLSGLASRILRHPDTGAVTATPTSILDRIIPQRPEIVARQAQEARDAELTTRGEDLMRRGRQQDALDRQAARSVVAPKETPEPTFVKLSEGPTANQHAAAQSIAREKAKEALQATPDPRSAAEAAQKAKGIPGSADLGKGRMVLTPEEARTEELQYQQNRGLSHRRGMSFSAGRVPATGRKVPMRPLPTETQEYPGPRSVTGTNALEALRPLLEQLGLGDELNEPEQ